MAVIRNYLFSVPQERFEEFTVRRKAAIEAVRAAFPVPVSTRLAWMENGSYSDVWTWESADATVRALANMPDLPEVIAAMSLVELHAVLDGQVVDES